MYPRKPPRLIFPQEFYDETWEREETPCIIRFAHQRIKIALQTGRIPWKVPVSYDPNCGLPCNVRTKSRYRGVNTILLCDTLRTKNLRSKWWGTRGDWHSVGCCVNGDQEPIVIAMCHDDVGSQFAPALVYNAAQIEGAEHFRASLDKLDALVVNDEADFGSIGRLLEYHAPDIRFDVGDENQSADWNGYVPPDPWLDHPNHKMGDYILMQSEQYFHSRADYYSILLHEMMHWAEVRTGWIDRMPAREFVAEAGMCILGLELGVPRTLCEFNHRKWLPYWTILCHEDEKFFFSMMAQVDRACDYLLSPLENGETDA